MPTLALFETNSWQNLSQGGCASYESSGPGCRTLFWQSLSRIWRMRAALDVGSKSLLSAELRRPEPALCLVRALVKTVPRVHPLKYARA